MEAILPVVAGGVGLLFLFVLLVGPVSDSKTANRVTDTIIGKDNNDRETNAAVHGMVVTLIAVGIIALIIWAIAS
jgi:hypothetical protein